MTLDIFADVNMLHPLPPPPPPSSAEALRHPWLQLSILDSPTPAVSEIKGLIEHRDRKGNFENILRMIV